MNADRKKFNISYILALSSLILIAVSLVIVAFWSFYPYKTITFLDDPRIVETRTVKAGDDIEFWINAVRHTRVAPKVTRSLENGIFIQFMPFQSSNFETGPRNDKVVFKIPESTPPGVYRLNTLLEFEMNPIRTIRKNIYTEEFEVIK